MTRFLTFFTLLFCLPAWSVAPPVAPGHLPASPAASPPASFEIVGRIKPNSAGKALRPVEAQDAVIYFRPRTPVPLAVPEAPALMNTLRKQFAPNALAIVAGASVEFPNGDPILHNAFSTSAGNEFDAGLYGQGEKEVVQFKRPGLVRVYCNVHHSMMAHILVLDSPFFAKPDMQGRFALKNLPTGDGELFIWHERATLWRKAVTVDKNLQFVVDLNLSKRRIPPHLNKFGKPYRRAGGGY